MVLISSIGREIGFSNIQLLVLKKVSITQHFQCQGCTTSVTDIMVFVGQSCVLENSKCILYILLEVGQLFSLNKLIYFSFSSLFLSGAIVGVHHVKSAPLLNFQCCTWAINMLG